MTRPPKLPRDIPPRPLPQGPSLTRPTLMRLAAGLVLAAGAPLAVPPEPARAATAVAPAAADPQAPADAEWILARLARPAPDSTPFVELRGSRLLKKPLRLQGEYRRPDAATLVREVSAPYAETTTIRAGEVELARVGKPPRRFSLASVPELAGAEISFGALLAGDRQRLEQHYRLATAGSRQRWSMTLTPREAALATRLHAITLYGRGAELRCIETYPVAGEPQRTLLAGAARAAEGVHGVGALAALCYGGARPVPPPAAGSSGPQPPPAA